MFHHFFAALTQVQSRIAKGISTTLSDFHRDMTLIFDNCRLYNVQVCAVACIDVSHPRS